MNSPITLNIDAWLDRAGNGPYAIERSWTVEHSQELIERLHEAITAPKQAEMVKLAVRCAVAERHALAFSEPPADMRATTVRIQATTQLGMAAKLLEELSCRSQSTTVHNAVWDPSNEALMKALDGKDEGLTMAQLRSIDHRDVFTLRRHLQVLVQNSVLRTWGEGANARYALSMQAVESME